MLTTRQSFVARIIAITDPIVGRPLRNGGPVISTTVIERRQTRTGLIPLAAWSIIVGALLQIVLGLALAPHQNPGSSTFGLITALNATSHLLLLVGVAGLLSSSALGPSRLGRGGVVLTLLGLVVLVSAEPTSLLNMEVAVVLYSVSTLAIMIGMILAGIAMVRGGRWTGWQRFTPLACGLFIPLILVPAFALPGYASNYAIGVWGVCWLLLGLAMRETDSAAI